jgi:hypothetical protein
MQPRGSGIGACPALRAGTPLLAYIPWQGCAARRQGRPAHLGQDRDGGARNAAGLGAGRWETRRSGTRSSGDGAIRVLLIPNRRRLARSWPRRHRRRRHLPPPARGLAVGDREPQLRQRARGARSRAGRVASSSLAAVDAPGAVPVPLHQPQRPEPMHTDVPVVSSNEPTSTLRATAGIHRLPEMRRLPQSGQIRSSQESAERLRERPANGRSRERK